MSDATPLVREEIARRFAQALDAEDYASVPALLHPECVYETGKETLRGPEAILASYRGNAGWAARTFDEIRYESAVHSGPDGAAVVEFVDHLRRRGQEWTHRCRQHLHFDAEGRIARIRHEDLPGEAEGLRRFFESAGVERPAAPQENGSR